MTPMTYDFMIYVTHVMLRTRLFFHHNTHCNVLLFECNVLDFDSHYLTHTYTQYTVYMHTGHMYHLSMITMYCILRTHRSTMIAFSNSNFAQWPPNFCRFLEQTPEAS